MTSTEKKACKGNSSTHTATQAERNTATNSTPIELTFLNHDRGTYVKRQLDIYAKLSALIVMYDYDSLDTMKELATIHLLDGIMKLMFDSDEMDVLDMICEGEIDVVCKKSKQS